MSVPHASVTMVDGPWIHRAVSANGARFHVAELGDGPLVLLIHGFPQYWWTWRHQLVALADAGYRAAAMDLRGYGGSDKTPRGYDPFTSVADVAGVIKSLGERDAVIVGHDWGGFLAWTMGVLRPDLVRRIVAVSMPHPRRVRSALTLDWRQVRASAHVLGLQLPWLPERRVGEPDGDYVASLLHDWSGPGWPDPETEARYVAAMRVPGVAHCSVEYFRWAVRSIPRPDGMRFAAQMRTPIRVPVLQLHGRLDTCILPTSARGSSHYVAAPYRWRLFDSVGHFPHEEDPVGFDEELLGWLADTSLNGAP
jgi:pimeloyl-ACP methyl ester carboxylesterase